MNPDNTEKNAELALNLATDGLIAALDNTPRNLWKNVIGDAMRSVKKLGYGEGYRVGFREDEKKDVYGIGPGMSDLPKVAADNATMSAKLNQYAGEDKALSNGKPTAAEEVLDEGYRFIAEIARQIGGHAVINRFDPKDVEVIFSHGELDGQKVTSLNIVIK